MKASPIVLGLLCAAGLALSGCNAEMPYPVYPSPRQEKGFVPLSTASFMVNKDDEEELRILGASLDGNAGSYSGYYVVLNRYAAGGRLMYFVDTLGYLSPTFIPDQHQLKSAFHDDTPGFLAYDNAGEIDRISFGSQNPETTIAAIQTQANALMANAKLGGVNWNQATGWFRYLVFESGTIHIGYSSTGIAGTMTTVGGTAIFPTGIADIVSHFTRLTDSSYWSQDYLEFSRFGYSALGGYSWAQARREDMVSGASEERLAVFPDGGGAIRTAAHTPLGTAGNYIIARDEPTPPGNKALVLDGSLNTHRTITIYGDDFAYLGEAQVLIDAIPTNCALFVVLTSMQYRDGLEGYLSLYAYPMSQL